MNIITSGTFTVMDNITSTVNEIVNMGNIFILTIYQRVFGGGNSRNEVYQRQMLSTISIHL